MLRDDECNCPCCRGTCAVCNGLDFDMWIADDYEDVIGGVLLNGKPLYLCEANYLNERDNES
jgi:hypothetical protein